MDGSVDGQKLISKGMSIFIKIEYRAFTEIIPQNEHRKKMKTEEILSTVNMSILKFISYGIENKQIVQGV